MIIIIILQEGIRNRSEPAEPQRAALLHSGTGRNSIQHIVYSIVQQYSNSNNNSNSNSNSCSIVQYSIVWTRSRTEPNGTEPRRVRKAQAEPRRIGKYNFPNRTEPMNFRKVRNRNEPKRIELDMCIHIYIYIYIYIQLVLSVCLSLSLSLYVYIYIYPPFYISIYIPNSLSLSLYIYIYIFLCCPSCSPFLVPWTSRAERRG